MAIVQRFGANRDRPSEGKHTKQALGSGMRVPKDHRLALTILVVDDVSDAREMYRSYFEFRGIRVISAVDGVAAIQSLLYETPDVIILDLAMPRMTGFEVLRTLKQNRWTKDIPVLVLSGRQAKAAALEMGADSYIEKPTVPEDLLREIIRVLREPKSHSDV